MCVSISSSLLHKQHLLTNWNLNLLLSSPEVAQASRRIFQFLAARDGWTAFLHKRCASGSLLYLLWTKSSAEITVKTPLQCGYQILQSSPPTGLWRSSSTIPADYGQSSDKAQTSLSSISLTKTVRSNVWSSKISAMGIPPQITNITGIGLILSVFRETQLMRRRIELRQLTGDTTDAQRIELIKT